MAIPISLQARFHADAHQIPVTCCSPNGITCAHCGARWIAPGSFRRQRADQLVRPRLRTALAHDASLPGRRCKRQGSATWLTERLHHARDHVMEPLAYDASRTPVPRLSAW